MDNKPIMVIVGGSGFFGSYLIDYFKDKYQVKVLSRNSTGFLQDVECLTWDAKTIGEWKNDIEGVEVLINLSGKSINCRFTEENKEKLLRSRVDSTRVLREAIKGLDNPPKVWFNASAGAMYKPKTKPNTEIDLHENEGFLTEMALAWEEEFFKDALGETRRVAMRISLLLGKNGGVFPVWKKLVNMFLGGKVGNGKQMVSWIHIDDAVRALDFIIGNPIDGPVNFSSNAPISNGNLMKIIRKLSKVSFGLPAPSIAIKLSASIVGVDPSLLLNGVNFIPDKLNKTDFKFNYSSFEEACADLIND